MRHRSGRRRAEAPRTTPGARPTPSADPRRARGPRPPAPRVRFEEPPDRGQRTKLDRILDEFTKSWERGENPRAEHFLERVEPADSAELIYHEYCLAEAADLRPDTNDYLHRFPGQAEALGRLFALHGAFSTATLARLSGPVDLPEVGDEIGPYRLIRELGQGAFARVFLAEETDLEGRLVVLKVANRRSSEPKLLARVRHANIVEVLRQAVANDGTLHLVCMPFLGGATLAEVLEVRRKRNGRKRLGRDFLSDLDHASAPEYPTPGSRPARELIAELTYAQALAWVMARLAQALDHARRRGVAHGDIKPSNILLTAEATPMLFDFNLAVDDRLEDEFGGEAGGTLAYMAPERLQALGDRGRNEVPPSTAGIDRHRADLYALGLVLLEALTGSRPAVASRAGRDLPAFASSLAAARQTLPDALRGRRGRKIPPALRAILFRCLAPDPLDRYVRGADLAEDLDRFRLDEPLAFAAEPGRLGVSRRFRRKRPVLASVALVGLISISSGLAATRILEGSRRDQALRRYEVIPGRSDSGAIKASKTFRWVVDDPTNPVEESARQLARYEVATDRNWRERDDVRFLPDRERDELEAWLMEQALRYAVGLAERNQAPLDWRRAVALLDRLIERCPVQPFLSLRAELLQRLGEAVTPPLVTVTQTPPHWLEAYLAGVGAEPLHAREALAKYDEVLASRPDLFWARYRAACAAARLDEHPQAARHLKACVDRYPTNPTLHALLGWQLWLCEPDIASGLNMADLGDALQECNRAISLDPDLATAYELRAKLRWDSGWDSFKADIDRFALLSRNEKPEGVKLSLLVKLPSSPISEPLTPTIRDLAMTQKIVSLDSGNIEERINFAAGLLQSDRLQEALDIFDHLVEIAPEHLRVRYWRAYVLQIMKRPEHLQEYEALIQHPRFEELYRESPNTYRAWLYVATDYLQRGDLDRALELAQRCLEQVLTSRSLKDKTLEIRNRRSPSGINPRCETLYLIGKIHAVAGRTDPARLTLAAETFRVVFAGDLMFRYRWFAGDRMVEPVRARLLELIEGK
jgi:serine/threonine protein kinase/predicted Zn-dependent protease